MGEALVWRLQRCRVRPVDGFLVCEYRSQARIGASAPILAWLRYSHTQRNRGSQACRLCSRCPPLQVWCSSEQRDLMPTRSQEVHAKETGIFPEAKNAIVVTNNDYDSVVIVDC